MEEREEQRSPDVRTDWRGVLPAMLLFLALVGGGLVWQAREDARAAEAERARVAVLEQQQLRAVSPAPTLRKGKPVKVKGKAKAMSSWVASGAGDSAYNGAYTESGTYDGKAAYTNGTKWLYWSGDSWWLSTNKGDMEPAAAYIGGGTDLPANSWSVNLGDSPAPTVSAGGGTSITTSVNPYSRPYTPVWWGGSALTESPIAPALVTVDSTLLVAFCCPADGGFALCDVAGQQWYWLAWDSAPFATWDTQQSGCLIDAGDGENVWCLSGGVSGPGFTCSKHSLLTGVRASQQAVTLESATITNMADLDGGTTAAFCERQSGTLRYHQYTLGAASYSEQWELTSWPGLPVGATEGSSAGSVNPDHHLYIASSGDAYYMRRYYTGVQPYLLTASGVERLPVVQRYGTGAYQSLGEYQDALLWGVETWYADNGYNYIWDPTSGAHVNKANLVAYPQGRYWWLTDQANGVLYGAGWGVGSAGAGMPWVQTVAPATITTESATLSLTASDMSIAERIGMEAATVALTASDMSIHAVERLGMEPAQVALVASDFTIIGQNNRTPGVVTAQFEWVRARALPS